MCISSLLDFLCVCVIHYAGDVSRWPLTQLVEESGRHGLIVNKLDTGNAAKFFGIFTGLDVYELSRLITVFCPSAILCNFHLELFGWLTVW
jgi:hypothetical protein